MRNLIGAVVSGLVVGVLARWVYWGTVPMGPIQTILLGIGGSVVANLAITRGRIRDGISQPGCLASVLGAMVIIFVVRLLAGG
jgi:uncharacterized membrane protein YeaQ/YmgE (transglycosylase-associated protein family)